MKPSLLSARIMPGQQHPRSPACAEGTPWPHPQGWECVPCPQMELSEVWLPLHLPQDRSRCCLRFWGLHGKTCSPHCGLCGVGWAEITAHRWPWIKQINLTPTYLTLNKENHINYKTSVVSKTHSQILVKLQQSTFIDGLSFMKLIKLSVFLCLVAHISLEKPVVSLFIQILC